MKTHSVTGPSLSPLAPLSRSFFTTLTLIYKTRCNACRVDVLHGLTPFVFNACIVAGTLALGGAVLFIFHPRYDSLLPSWRVREAKGEARMEWVTPGHEEVDLSCEVSGYANAEL